MAALISDEDVLKASKAFNHACLRDVYNAIWRGGREYDPRWDGLDLKTWAELLMQKGRRVYGDDNWAAIFREEADQPLADAIIRQLCAIPVE